MYRQSSAERSQSPHVIKGGKMEKHFNPVTGDRYTNMADAKGNRIPGATADIKLVKDSGSPESLASTRIDARGADDPSEIIQDTIEDSEERGGKELFEKYLETIFRRFISKTGGEIYRSGDINKTAVGNRANLTQGPGEYIYFIKPSDSEEMKKCVDEGIKLSSSETGINFSHVVGAGNVDVLDRNGLGFTRRLDIGNEVFTVKFLYANEDVRQAA